MTPQDAWSAIEARFLGQPNISRSTKKGFAEGGLMTSGKLFAIRRDKGLLAKLPSDQVKALIETGLGAPAIIGGRTLREWLWVLDEAADGWPDLATDAEAFVRELTAL
ncbi:MAG: hypothetical protein ACXU82_12195 [Caulobacteraceae bacterium]